MRAAAHTGWGAVPREGRWCAFLQRPSQDAASAPVRPVGRKACGCPTRQVHPGPMGLGQQGQVQGCSRQHCLAGLGSHTRCGTHLTFKAIGPQGGAGAAYWLTKRIACVIGQRAPYVPGAPH